MSEFKSWSLLATRAVVAAIFLWHGVPKAIDWPSATAKFVNFGLPGFLGPITGVAEVVASVLLLAGVWFRIGSGVLVLIVIGALITVQIPRGVTAGLERDLLILTALTVLMAFGPGSKVAGNTTASGERQGDAMAASSGME